MKALLASFLLLALAPVASASEPIESIDAFEAAMTRCFRTAPAPATCIDANVRGHFPPGNERVDEAIPRLTELFQRWLGKDKVFAVHMVKRTVAGTYAERRVYVIEDTAGNVMMLEAAFIHRLGKWYVFKYNLTNTKDDIQAVLGDVL